MRKNKLMISAITLAFAVVAVVSTTFAWFTMNTTNTVDNLDFSAQSSTGLYMSLDGSNWKTSLGTDDFAAYAATDAANIKGFESGFKLNPITLLADGTTFANHKNETDKVGGYVQFTINFKSDVASKVKVSVLTVTSETSTGSIKYVTGDNASDTDNFWAGKDTSTGDNTMNFTTSLANAVRVKLDSTNDQYIDPSIADGTAAAYGGIEADLEKSYSHQYINHVSPNEAKEIASAFDKNTNGSVEEIYNTYAALDKTTELLTLAKAGDATDYTGSVTVTLWVEGFDNDCFDVLFNSKLKLNITFEAFN